MNGSLPGSMGERLGNRIIDSRDVLFAVCIPGSCMVVSTWVMLRCPGWLWLAWGEEVIDDVQPSGLTWHISYP